MPLYCRGVDEDVLLSKPKKDHVVKGKKVLNIYWDEEKNEFIYEIED